MTQAALHIRRTDVTYEQSIGPQQVQPPPPLLCVILLLQHVFLLHFANICRGGACVFLSSSFLPSALSFAPTPQLSAVFRISAVSVRAMMATNMERTVPRNTSVLSN